MKQSERHSRETTETPIRDVEMLASATECTGLTPAAVQSPQEGEAYAELYAIHQQKPAWNHEQPEEDKK